MKKNAIELLRTAEINLLNSFKGIRPSEVDRRTQPEFNSISWIFGHCVGHFHMVLCSTCQDVKLLTDDALHYYRYGTSKEEIDSSDSPLTFGELVDEYLKVSQMGFNYLEQLGEADFHRVMFPEIQETLSKSVQRMALHYLGHVGQIVLIRRALGNPGFSFVGGVQENDRKRMFEDWNNWWKESRESFGI